MLNTGVRRAGDDTDAAECGQILLGELDYALHGAVGIGSTLQGDLVPIGYPLFERLQRIDLAALARRAHARMRVHARRDCHANQEADEDEGKYFVHACRPLNASVCARSQSGTHFALGQSPKLLRPDLSADLLHAIFAAVRTRASRCRMRLCPVVGRAVMALTKEEPPAATGANRGLAGRSAAWLS